MFSGAGHLRGHEPSGPKHAAEENAWVLIPDAVKLKISGMGRLAVSDMDTASAKTDFLCDIRSVGL